jgi:hypothetical protein
MEDVVLSIYALHKFSGGCARPTNREGVRCFALLVSLIAPLKLSEYQHHDATVRSRAEIIPDKF